MKKYKNWWIEDKENFHKVLSVLDTENFGCVPILDAAFQHVKKFDRAIDIGTWIGDSTSIMCKSFSWVWAFEANPSIFECCKQNLNDRNYDNFVLLNYALSNNRKKQPFFTGEKSSSGGWIGTNTLQSKSPVTNVECRTLDDFDFKEIDFIKIDVDSHEGYLVSKSTKFFKQNNPVIAIEYKEAAKGRQDKACPNPLNILNDIGYKVVEKIGTNDYIMVR